MSDATPVKRIVLVGHCFPDKHVLKGTLPTLHDAIGDGVAIEVADDPQSLESLAKSDSLLLINRVLEPGFETTSGLELMRDLAGLDQPPRLMLISNYDDAQEEARQLGALPGFGKSQLGKATTRERLEAALN